jgi:hypothetical protein
VTPEARADDGCNRSDEAVRRMRQESAQRIARERRWRGFTSGCALASILGVVSLAGLNAYDAREQRRADLIAAAQQERTEAEEGAVQEKERAARIAAACAKRAAALEAIDTAASQAVRRARSSDERTNIRLQAAVQSIAIIDDAATAGCEEPVPLHDYL